jgi:acyl dehydratase
MTETDQTGQVRVLYDIRGRRTTFEELEIGKDLGSAEFLLTQEHVDQECEKFRFHHPYYEVDSPFGGTVAPISLTYLLPRNLFSRAYSVRGLFYKWEFETREPVKPDVKYIVSARLADKWIRNDREFVAYTAECRDGAGNLIYTTRRAHVMDFIKRTAPKVGEGGISSSAENSAEAIAVRSLSLNPDWDVPTAAGSGTFEVTPVADQRTTLGAALPPNSSYWSQREFERIERKSNATTLHFDVNAANQEGLPAPVATGPYVMELIHRSAMQFFGAGWIRGGRADLTVVRPTFPGEYVMSSGTVTGIEREKNGALRITCQATVKNQKGEVKIAGKVSGLVS